METSARELNQQTSKILARVEQGESVVITKSGKPIALMRPYTEGDEPVRPFRTDPMGADDDAPVLTGGPSDLASRADDYLAEGFGL
ncbi:type II toxin-antitoxin system Phd/YefM family antitoxin [Streptomyces sp. SYSU K217416]